MKTVTPKLEVYLGNWGTIVCFNEQHKEYLKAAKNHRDIYQAITSWYNKWLTPTMQQEYKIAMEESKSICDSLWDAIPDKTEDMSKSHF